MPDWTHSICKDCWNKRNPDRPYIGDDAGDLETCCFCGKRHQSGLYVRHNPEELQCKGEHPE